MTSRVLVGALVLLASSCITGKTILQRFNQRGAPQAVNFLPCERSLEESVPDLLGDVYDTTEPLRWLDQRAATDALTDAAMCLRATGDSPRSSDCLACLFSGRNCGAGAQWLRLPPPPALDSQLPQAWHVERDVQRVEQHVQALLKTITQRCLVNGEGELSGAARARLRQGFEAGLATLTEYETRRGLNRAPNRPVTTWVLSGGAANGAFSAGAAWWLLQQHRAGGNACETDRLDMLGGASAGTVIATAVKKYFDGAQRGDGPQQQTALDLLADNFTCTANQDLYCVQDLSLADAIAADGNVPRGLVNFRPTRTRLDAAIDEKEITRPPEQFASTVEFLRGDVQFVSSAMSKSKYDWLDSLEGSLVEPLLAEPVPFIRGRAGVWIDGGVRSGLPLTTPLRRGADRALVFVNTALNGVPKERLPSAASIGFRAIDLFSLQPIVGELASSELEATVRRQLEKERCLERLGASMMPERLAELTERCGHSTAQPLFLADEMPHPRQGSPKSLRNPTAPMCSTLAPASDTYASSWLFMPEKLPDFAGLNVGEVNWSTLAAIGYEFNPRETWNLFVLGALTAQERCNEINDTLAWHLPASCGDRRAALAALKTLRKRWDDKGCYWNTPKLVDCPK